MTNLGQYIPLPYSLSLFSKFSPLHAWTKFDTCTVTLIFFFHTTSHTHKSSYKQFTAIPNTQKRRRKIPAFSKSRKIIYAIVTLPPAFSTASIADLEAELTVILMLELIAPRASKRTPSNFLLTKLAFIKDSTVIS